MQVRGHKTVFIINAIRMALLLFVLDFAVGAGMKSLYMKQRTGKQARIIHSVTETQADILIFGSSRAVRHFIPSTISETLGLSCYNSGVQGKGILFMHGLQTLILNRYTPKIILLNIDAQMLNESPVQYSRLADLLPYYQSHPDLMEPFLRKKSRFEKIKMISRIYPYNSTIVHIVRYWLAPQKDYDGYLPLRGQMAPVSGEPPPETPVTTTPTPEHRIDPNFVEALNGFITNAAESGASLYFILSPTCIPISESDRVSLNKIKQIAESHGVPILDYSNDPRFRGAHTLFRDFSHLNHEGAKLLSALVAEDLRRAIGSKP